MADLNTTNVSVSKKVFIVAGMIVAGTGSIIFGKLQYQTKTIGKDGKMHYFTRALFQNLITYLGMSFCFLIMLTSKKKQSPIRKEKNKNQRLFKIAKSVFPISLCDITATYILNISLIFLPASVWQLLRASMIVFTAILTKYYLKTKVHLYQWIGVFHVVLGLLIVGVGGIVGSEEQEGQQFSIFVKTIGVFLVITAELFQSFQTILEEKLLHNHKDSSPELIIQFEGLFGIFYTIVVIAPIAYYLPESTGMKEDLVESLIMFKNSNFIIITSILLIIFILFYNYFAMNVTNFGSALLRNILSALRNISIWIVLLVVHYSNPKYKLGEKWTKWSYIQALGFIFYVFGTFLYNRIIMLPCIKYPSNEKSILEKEHGVERGNLLKDSDSITVDLSEHLSETSSNYSNNPKSSLSSMASSVN
ncbi:solute carrier family 35 member f6 [Anaeramoeba flamelloides]|uniref:Solute carrier family 35 member f6 n=1 Tax=Anaeramoeba flamelloides TaxID=1746091 RepID=A0ABQ8XJ19_9EUKA|nr:solute carrier family 35 member f6 [Anaeramoeba flamelloides]